MSNEIFHIKSRCGGGKSLHTVQEMYPYIAKKPNDTIIFASKTNKLTKQNYEVFTAVNNASANPVNSCRIDIETTPASTTVREELTKALDHGFQGVIFVSHAILATIDTKKLRNIELIIDEVPSTLVQHLEVHYEFKDQGSTWEQYIMTVPCSHANYQRVIIKPDADREDIQRRIDNPRRGFDNSITKEVVMLLEFLLEGHEVMYTRRYSSDGKFLNIYQAIRWQKLEEVIGNSRRVAILSAQLRDTLTGFVLEKVMKKAITEIPILDNLPLPTLHLNRARIYPIIVGSKWSSYLKKKPANEALLYQGKPVKSLQSVCLYAQEIAAGILQGKNSLLFLNAKEDQHELLTNDTIKKISTSSHGQNSYTRFDHAVYLASNRPDRNEENSLKLFAEDHGYSGDEIMKALLTERCYETAYQCVARTSIRNKDVDQDKEHIFIVPDEKYAEYLKGWFDGSATIDITYLHSLQPSLPSQLKDKKNLDLVRKIRSDYIAKKGKLKNLLVKYDLKEKTYKRYIERFRKELESDGLIKPKRKIV
ncbi:MAG: hypothetical protein ACQEUK_06370 [Pseudomonadota bacterium]